ncbi:unnamed protein product [Rhizopus stolonifer]
MKTSSTCSTKDETYWSQFASSFEDKIIDQEYQLLELLGHGAYGCLFLGQSVKDNSYVAVKILLKSPDLQQLQLQQLEMDIQSQLKHPHLLALHRATQDQDYLYMIMELCDQGDLFDFVIKDQNLVRDQDLIKTWFCQILDAVDHMHQQGLYHRDLKLENILLQSETDTVCKVADFGLATRERYSLEFGCGSTSYLAPEHFEDDGTDLVPYDAAASDVWSLGILLLTFMFGRNPWQEASHADPAYHEFTRSPSMLKDRLFPELSLATLHWLQTALAAKGHDRPSVAALKEQFLAIEHLYYDKQNAVSIPTVAKQTNVSSYDSAYFSGGGMSWADMVEEEEAQKPELELGHHPAMFDTEDTDMFAHSGESWWL